MDEYDVRIVGYCEECGDSITDDIEICHCDEEGHLFCCKECALIYCGIHELEI